MAKDDLFIPHGAFLTCDKGATVMTLKATPKKHNLYALPIATESDNVPLVNIPCFGVCSINGSACMPVAPQWKSVHGGAQKVLGKAPLISTSYCKCQKGGNIKIFLDRKSAEAALEDDKKSRVDGIPWLDGAIGNALLGPVGIIVNKAYGSDDVSEGIGRGFRKGLKGTWNFLSDDMWKADTWKGMGKMAAVGVVGYGGAIIPGYGPTQRLKDFDKTFGTELNQTHEAIGNAISSTWDEKVVNGTAAERSELAGQTAEMVLEAVVGSKGAGAVAKGSMAGAKMALGAERVAEIAESIAKLRQAVKLENLAAKVRGIFKVGELRVRGITYEDFLKSCKFPNDEVAQEAWKHFKDKNWKKLEELVQKHDLNDKWPPNRGFIHISETTLKKGKTFDRYGGRYNKITGKFEDTGKFIADKDAPFSSRALPEDTKLKPYKSYEVLKPIENVKKGDAIPWFEQDGMGPQYELPKGIDDLIKEGYIKEIN